jgi:hypothetical protein
MRRIISDYYIQSTNHHFDGAIKLLEVKTDMAVNAQQQQRDDVDTFNLMIPHLISVIGYLRTAKAAHIRAGTFGGSRGEEKRGVVTCALIKLEKHLEHDTAAILQNLKEAKLAWQDMLDMDSVSQP